MKTDIEMGVQLQLCDNLSLKKPIFWMFGLNTNNLWIWSTDYSVIFKKQYHELLSPTV